EVPNVPLARLYGDELREWFAAHGVAIRLNEAAASLEIADGRVCAVRLRTGVAEDADVYVSAVPFDRLLALLPDDVTARHEYFSNLRHLGVSPITSVHLWFARPITPLPHVV